MTYQPLPGVLEEIARVHYFYELRMLIDQATALHPPPPDDQWDFGVDAVLEAALLHARVLNGFFGGKLESTSDAWDDVVAVHYAPSWQPKGFLPPKDAHDLNKQLAHLSGSRRQRRDWVTPFMAVKACRMHLRFVDHLESEVADWFDRSTSRAGVALRRFRAER